MKLLICKNHRPKGLRIRHFKGTTYIVISIGKIGIYFWYKTNKVDC